MPTRHQTPCSPSLADLHTLFAAHGTSVEALDDLVVALIAQLIEKRGRPVTEEEISDYVNECEPYLRPLLALVDNARAVAQSRRSGRGKRLTIEQRQAILVMLHEGVRGADIARTFGITPAAISTYKRQIRAMDEEDRGIRFNIMSENATRHSWRVTTTQTT